MAKKQTKKPEAKEAKLVKMEREGKSADVHPDEVANYQAGGWQKK